MPEASRTVTNMSEMVTETATAKASSGVRCPAITVRLTASGWPTAASTLSDRPRLSMAIWAKSMTCCTLRACSESGGSVRTVRSSAALERCRPRTSNFWPSSENCPPLSRIRR